MPAIRYVRRLNADDRALLAVVLLTAGAKARVRKFPTSVRVVFEGSQDAVAQALNDAGFLAAGGAPFSVRSFNGGRNELFVHSVAA